MIGLSGCPVARSQTWMSFLLEIAIVRQSGLKAISRIAASGSGNGAPVRRPEALSLSTSLPASSTATVRPSGETLSVPAGRAGARSACVVHCWSSSPTATVSRPPSGLKDRTRESRSKAVSAVLSVMGSPTSARSLVFQNRPVSSPANVHKRAPSVVKPKEVMVSLWPVTVVPVRRWVLISQYRTIALNSVAGITASVLLQTLRQFIVPDQLMARGSSVMGMLGVGIGLPLGSVAGGLLAHTFGLRAPFLVSSALIALTVIVVPRISTAFEVLEARAE